MPSLWAKLRLEIWATLLDLSILPKVMTNIEIHLDFFNDWALVYTI
jgi:hypothetical protein